MKRLSVLALSLCLAAAPVSVKAAAVMTGTQPWPKGEVPYRIAPDLLRATGARQGDCTGWAQWRSTTQAAKACRAMDAWQAATGVRFYADDRRLDRLDVINGEGQGTDGTLGHLPIGNRIRVETGASYGSVLHEFGHVLGLMHEHQRPDRDQYIRLEPFLQKDIDHCGLSISAVCNDVRVAFPKVPVQMSTAYDPCSLMHYLSDQTPRHREDARWQRIFSLTAKGDAALKTCAGQFARLPDRCRKVGQKCAISQADAALVRRFEGPH